MRKHSAGLQRDKSDLGSLVEGLKVELGKRERGIKRSGSRSEGIESMGGADGEARFQDEEGEDEEEDVFRAGGSRRKTGEGFLPGSPGDLFSEFDHDGDGEASLLGSPAAPHGHGEEGTLKSGLAHAQRTIATLRTSLAREKAAKMELRRQLAGGAAEGGGGGGGGNDSWEEEESEVGMGTPARSSRRGRGARGRGGARRGARGGGGAGGAGPSRLAKEFAGDSSIDSIDEEEVQGDSFDSPGGGNDGDGASIFEHQFPSSGGAGVGGEDGSEGGFDSPLPAIRPRHRSRNSVHSFDMDPAFAHHQGDDTASIRSRDSYAYNPQSTLADVLGAGGGGNGRPASIVSFGATSNRPTSGMFSGFDIEQEASLDGIGMERTTMPVSMAEVGVMTEPLPELALLGESSLQLSKARRGDAEPS